MRYAEGGNYRVDVIGAVATCTVWKRPDVSREDGMRFAAEKVEVFQRLAAEPRVVVRGLVFDLRDAPTMWGPVTQECLETMVHMFEIAGRRIAIVVGDDALQGLQIKRILKERAPQMGQIFTSVEDADAWTREPISVAPARK